MNNESDKKDLEQALENYEIYFKLPKGSAKIE